MLTVLLGGARSGKSTAALELAARHDGAVAFIATAPSIDGDVELAARIAVHRAERPASWRTIEAEIHLAAALHDAGDSFVIVDCLTVWLGNLLHHGHDDESVDRLTDDALSVATTRSAPTVVVSNEVGFGIVPADAESRRYRDLLGRVNQRWVAASDRAVLLVAGRAISLDEPDGLLRGEGT